jgi:hypothetical protein
MNGLGFRPLRYKDGTGPQGVTLIEQFNNLFSQNRIPELVLLVQRNPETFFPIEELPSNIAGIVKELVDQKLVTLPPTAEAITEGTEGNLGRVPQMQMPTQQMQMPTQREVDPGFLHMSKRINPVLRSAPADFSGAPADVGTMTNLQFPDAGSDIPIARKGNPGAGIGDNWLFGHSGASPEGRNVESFGYQDAANILANDIRFSGQRNEPMPWDWRHSPEEDFGRGGHVQRMAHGGYASRGTVAGELPRYGDMSVREEGETMRELSKRHRDQDWYNRMGGGLGSLRRRVA